MKLFGKKLDTPNRVTIVLPRLEGGDLVFTAQAVLDYDDFEKLCPAPNPPTVLKPGGITLKNVEDPKYLAALDEYAEARMHWTVLKSLSATEGLEWETVKFDDPSTWKNYDKELTQACLSRPEVARLVNAVGEACGLNQEKIDEATERFLATRGKEVTT